MDNIYRDISKRTQGDIYIGVVGPVRSGKSTFIKRFMENTVIPNIDNIYIKERARDELPQSGAGKTIMTSEPKFVPEEAINLVFDDNSQCNIRLIDCVGYMVDGAVGISEDGVPRMVSTPWSDKEITMVEAAEIGTKKVIRDHSTIGLVITTDGSITGIPRENYIPAEEKVIEELREINKPFIVLVNSTNPAGNEARKICNEIYEKYGVVTIPVNCQTIGDLEIRDIIKAVLNEFSISDFNIFLPEWIGCLSQEHPIKKEVYSNISDAVSNMGKIRDIDEVVDRIKECELVSGITISSINLGSGDVDIKIHLPRKRFYKLLSEKSGYNIENDGDLVPLLERLSVVESEYKRVSDALNQVRETGYGIVMPNTNELELEEPEIVKQGGQYGVRLRASAPSIHMLRADITAEVAPIVGSERQSEELVLCMLKEYENNPNKIWESNIFGKSIYDLVNEGLHSKLNKIPQDARMKLKETVERITNENCQGLICIII